MFRMSTMQTIHYQTLYTTINIYQNKRQIYVKKTISKAKKIIFFSFFFTGGFRVGTAEGKYSDGYNILLCGGGRVIDMRFGLFVETMAHRLYFCNKTKVKEISAGQCKNPPSPLKEGNCGIHCFLRHQPCFLGERSKACFVLS